MVVFRWLILRFVCFDVGCIGVLLLVLFTVDLVFSVASLHVIGCCMAVICVACYLILCYGLWHRFAVCFSVLIACVCIVRWLVACCFLWLCGVYVLCVGCCVGWFGLFC